MKRLKLILILASMPSEAFGWLVVALANPPGRNGQVWPDGLGGFRSESRASIEAAIAEARVLMEGGEVV